MKTHTFSLKSLFYIGLAVVALVACNKKDDNNGNLATTPGAYSMINGVCYNNLNQPVANTMCMNNGGYYLSNGVCYTSNGQMMPNTSYCMNSNNGYYLNNGICYASNGQAMPNTSYCMNNYNNTGGYYMSGGYCYGSNGQVVATNFCSNYSNYNGGMMGQQCYGSYLYQSGYWSQMVWCNGANCRGYTLYEVNTNRSVVCQ